MTRQTWTTPALLLLAACTAGGIPTSSGGSGGVTIDINLTLSKPVQTPYGLSGGFTPAVTTIPVGSQFHFTNTDSFAHTGSYLGSRNAVPHRLPAQRAKRTTQIRQYALRRNVDQRRAAGGHVVADDYRRPARERICSAASSITARRCGGRSLRSSVAAAGLAALFLVLACAPARAIPIFAQRYHFKCGQCHSVLPELNAFGRYFRSHGYRLPLPEHGTTIFALRYQMEYDKEPAAGSREFTPGGIILGSANVGPITAYLHYGLGAGGGPGGVFLLFAAGYDAHTQTLVRGGLIELPLAQSPGERLDDLTQYGYYGAHVGLNNLPLSSNRWGLQIERTFGHLTADGVVAFGRIRARHTAANPCRRARRPGCARRS